MSMGSDLITVNAGNDVQLYDRMQTAISLCWSVDDCKQISDQSTAIAAYYKQVRDDESVRKFLQVKLRAWRRIGEIVVGITGIYKKGKQTQIDYFRAAKSKGASIGDISVSSLIQAVRLAEVPDDFFEKHADSGNGISWLLFQYEHVIREEWLNTPAGQAEREAEEERFAQAQEREREYHRKRIEKAKQEEKENQDFEDYKNLRDAAFGEVGVTMDRRDRKEMKEIVFLIKAPVHEQLRKAAFDKKVTMQSILRAGLKMWFIAHDYPVPDFGDR